MVPANAMSYPEVEEIRITIADDHPVVRAGLARVIESQAGYRVVGQAGNGSDAVEQIKSLKPDIAVLDISMPGMTGIEVIERLHKSEETEFILLTQHAPSGYLDRARTAGASGYVRKDSALDELVTAIAVVLDGRFYASGVGDPNGEVTSEPVSLDPDGLQAIRAQLTPTELRVLSYLAQNLTSKEIASALHVSYRTVQKPPRQHVWQARTAWEQPPASVCA